MNTNKALNKLADSIHADNVVRGYWKNGVELHKKLLLITSEVTELMEADRKTRYATRVDVKALISETSIEDYIKFYEREVKGTVEEEGADILIRTLDLLKGLRIDIDSHVEAKRLYTQLKGIDPAKKY